MSARAHQSDVRMLLRENRRDLSLVDCVSFGVMNDLGLRHAFAFGPHFERAGFLCSTLQRLPELLRACE
ncbi:MAG: hypothetical protein AB1714_20490 [Acidobacteriota bacterium]